MLSLFRAVVSDLQAVADRILGIFDLTPAALRQLAFKLVVIWLLAWIGWQLVKLLARRIVAIADDHHGETVTFREKRAQTIAQLVRSAGRGVVLVTVVLLTLNQFINISALFGWAAVLGLAVSFGAQSLVKDYFAGFFILLENQFVVGDVIEAAGKSGVVEHLTLRTVTLRDIEGVVHVIPNGQITVVSNKTRGWSRAVVDVGLSYDNDIDAAIKVLTEEAADFAAAPDWAWKFESAPSVLGVESFTDNGPVIRILLQTKPGMQNEVAREFRRRMMIRLERDGIKGARAQQTINIHPSLAIAGADTARPAAAPPAPDPNASPIPGSA